MTLTSFSQETIAGVGVSPSPAKERPYLNRPNEVSLPSPVLPERLVRQISEARWHSSTVSEAQRLLSHTEGLAARCLKHLPEPLTHAFTSRYTEAVELALVTRGTKPKSPEGDSSERLIDAVSTLIAIAEVNQSAALDMRQIVAPAAKYAERLLSQHEPDRTKLMVTLPLAQIIENACSQIAKCGRSKVLCTELVDFLLLRQDSLESENRPFSSDPLHALSAQIRGGQRRATALSLAAVQPEQEGSVRKIYAAKRFGAAVGAMQSVGDRVTDEYKSLEALELVPQAVYANLKRAFSKLLDAERDGYRMLWKKLTSGPSLPKAVDIQAVNPALGMKDNDVSLPSDPARVTTKYGYNLGPFFVQPRVGEGGDTIMVYKLRTMISLKRSTTLAGAIDPVTGKQDQSENFTRFGKFLRRSHIDELPNLLNFARGELSLLGMRPLVHSEFEKLPDTLREAYAINKPSIFPVVYAFSGVPTIEDPHCNAQRLEFLERYYAEVSERPLRTVFRYGLMVAKKIFLEGKRGI